MKVMVRRNHFVVASSIFSLLLCPASSDISLLSTNIPLWSLLPSVNTVSVASSPHFAIMLFKHIDVFVHVQILRSSWPDSSQRPGPVRLYILTQHVEFAEVAPTDLLHHILGHFCKNGSLVISHRGRRKLPLLSGQPLIMPVEMTTSATTASLLIKAHSCLQPTQRQEELRGC